MDKEFLSAFAEVIREQVVQKNTVEIKELGTFKQEHKQQFQQQRSNGQVVMVPPRDVIRFIPD